MRRWRGFWIPLRRWMVHLHAFLSFLHECNLALLFNEVELAGWLGHEDVSPCVGFARMVI